MRTQETAGNFVHEDKRNIEEEVRRILPKLTAAVFGGLMSQATLPGGYSPFGAAFIAAVPQENIAVSTIGGIIGCFIGGGMLTSLEGLRHVASIIAVAGIRWALGELKSVSKARFFPLFTAFMGILLTGMVINNSIGEIFSYNTVFFAIEGAMSGIAAMFFSNAAEAFNYYDKSIKLSRQSSSSVIITLCIALIPICKLDLFGVSIGLILMHTAVLMILPAKREIGGAVAGIATGCVTALSQYNVVQGAICPIAALLAGYTAAYGKIFSASTYIAISFIGSLASGTIDYTFFAETVIASIIACIVPSEFAERALAAAGFVNEQPKSQKAADNAAVINRLTEAASALTGVSSVVEQVSDKLDKLNAPEIDAVYRRSAAKVCSGCSCLNKCWKDNMDSTGSKIKNLTDILKKSGSVSGINISDALGRKCIHESEFAGEINSQYGYHIASQSARRRISQVRSVINDQLEGVGMMLTELSEEIGAIGHDNEYSVELLSSSLKSCGYVVDSVQCTSNRSGRLKVTLNLRTTDHVDLEKCEIGEYVGETLGCEFVEPRFDGNEKEFTVYLTQKQNYMLSFGGAQHCCDGESLCGDAYEAFVDGEGNAYMLISDGMGSGGRAAVDGAMACKLLSRLLKGGFSYKGAMKIVNSALLIKSEDESLSTIDSLKLNLYSGRAMFCKAGAAQSYHVRDGVVNRIDIESLPLGILRETDTAQYSFTAEEGDIIIMISDGVPTDDSMWFENLLKKYNGESARDFAKFLLNRAVSHRPEGEDDDITVVIGRIIAA